MLIRGSRAVLAFGLLGWIGACAGQQEDHAGGQSGAKAPSSMATNTAASAHQGAAGSGVTPDIAGSSAPVSDPATSGTTTDGTPGDSAPSGDGCAANLPSKKAGCPCQGGETAACWTGPAADRNIGKCHDGLQLCTANGEFAEWGPCMGEELSCGTDAGVPPPPDAGVPPEECSCIPGAVIQCSEDCSVGIICSLTATKTCLPDRTWSTCREDTGAALDLPGVQCRNMLHGCLNVLSDGSPSQGQGEVYVGDCSTQFACGHAPELL